MKKAIHQLSLILDKISAVITSVLLVGLCLVIDFSVVMRFIFNNPVQWQYELTLVGLCWATFIGMPMVFHKQEHLRLTFITDHLKPKTWCIYMDIIDIVLIVFLISGIVNSISVVKTAWSQYYQTLPMISRGHYYLSFPIGCVFSIVHLIDIILNRTPDKAPTAQKKEEVAA